MFLTSRVNCPKTRDGQSRTFGCSRTVLELNISNLEFRTRSIILESFWQNYMTKYITSLFGVIIPVQNTFIAAQRTQVIWIFPFERNFSFGAVHSAGEKHLSADSNVVGIAKYLFTNFCKTRNCFDVCV